MSNVQTLGLWRAWAIGNDGDAWFVFRTSARPGTAGQRQQFYRDARGDLRRFANRNGAAQAALRLNKGTVK